MAKKFENNNDTNFVENLEHQTIVEVDIEKRMKEAFIDYSMSVIISRALPDVRDGLKPVHRRILYAMFEEHLTADKPFFKSATTVGNVIGRYHPHGDASAYDALVRMAQDFSLRYPLIDGHGNFGSIDGDPPAAYRYTEARMSKISNELLADIDKDTVDFVPNFDEKRKEPVVLPTRIPVLLCNGVSGIAVGMATNIPSHNLREVINAAIAQIDNPEITVDELMEHIQGPDFPTRATIMGRGGIRSAYETGKGATGCYNGERYYLGNRRLLAITQEKKGHSIENKFSQQGKTAVFLATEKKILAVFAVADILKAESKSAVADLKQKNIRVGMLTGDNESVAKAIAEEVGISDYFAEALPEDKAKAVQRVRSVGGFVAMVGDGVNDSPALKEADIGVAMGNGTDIAIESADVVLSGGNLQLVGTMVELSKKTVQNIKQNLFWAFFYNCVAIPVAAGSFSFAGISLNPMISAACMSLSSLFVVTNALRLTKFSKKQENKGENSMKKTLKIEGMMCQHCVAHVTKALQGVAGVTNVEVNLKKKTAIVESEEVLSNEVLTAVITEAGYEVKKIS